MSVLRGLYLRRVLTKSLTKSNHLKSITFTLLLAGLFATIAFSNWAGFAARRAGTGKLNSTPASIDKLPPVSTRGPVSSPDAALKYSAFQAAPFQGCTVNCTATVPATGTNGAAISFEASATTSGCSAAPVYEWNFGDSTPKSNVQNTTHSYASAGAYAWTLTTTVGGGSTMVDTIAGGFGEGNLAKQSPFGVLAAIARDPQGRGIYVADAIGNSTYIRFVNTSNAAATLAGRTIEPGRVRVVAGGGIDISDNAPATQSELGTVTGLAVSSDGALVYFIDQVSASVRAINVSASNQTVGGQTVNSGRIGTLAGNFGTSLNGLAYKASTNEVFVCDSTAGVNKVFRISAAGQSTVVAGNGATTKADDAFGSSGGPAVNIPLLQPRGVEINANGEVLIADTGHGRVILVNAGGNAFLVNQFTINQASPNPYPSSVAVFGGNAYVANGNQQTIVRVTGVVATIAGTVSTSCDYSASTCGDGGPASGATFNMLGSTATPPIAGIESDNNGIFVLDQGVTGRGRIRYINLTGGTVNLAGTNIPAGAIETIGGSGLTAPYDGGLATGATFNTPTGVAVDGNGNLWISDTISARLRFANRGASSVTLFAGTQSEQVVPAGQIVTVNKNVGAGANDGVPVIQAAFDSLQGLFVTSQGVYIADSKGGPQVPPQFSGRRTSLIRFVNTTGASVTLFAGSSSPIVVPAGNVMKIAGGSENTSNNGDGSFATNAKFIAAADVAVTANGTIYVADVGQKAVRKIDGSTGVVSSLTSLGTTKEFTGVALDGQGRLLVANYTDGTILRENSAGGGTFSTPALASGLNKPRDVAVTSDGTIYATVGPAVSTTNTHQIVSIPAGGGSPTVVGGGAAGFAGDGGAASGASFNLSPSPLVVGSGVTNQLPETVNIVANGLEVIFTDSNNNRIRRISPGQTICTKTGTITIQGDNPAPVIASISPTSANQNAPAFTLTVNGTGFVPTSVIRWKGLDRTTTFVSNTQLTAQIPASDLTAAGVAAVTVFNPAPGGGTSNSVNFTVNAPNPVPAIASISPNSAAEGSPGFTLTITGSGFVNGSSVRWDGQARTTTFVSATQLTAQILASDLVGAGTAAVTVFNPTPGGGVSNTSNFTITSTQNPQPALTSISPSAATAGGAAFVMTLSGNNFLAASKARWNGADLTTAFGSATQLTAQVPANLIAAAGMAQVTVFNPAPGGGSSASLTFTINPTGGGTNPTIATISPAGVTAGGAGFTLTVNGTNYVSGSTVRVGNNARSTTFVSATQLTASVLASDIASAASLDITVINPGNSTASNAVKLEVVPNVASVSAASFLGQSIAAESIVAAFGVNLATGVEVATAVPLPTTLLGTTVKVRDAEGVERNSALFFVAPSQINYQVPAGTIDGVATVTVVSNNKIVGVGSMTIAKVAPGLISANSNGTGVAAAVALRANDITGMQTFEAVSRFDQGTSRFVPILLDLGPDLGNASDQIYLIMYGTGFRGVKNDLMKVNVKLGGVNVPVLFADAAPGFVGLDQANLGPIPRSLIGRNAGLDLVMTVDGKIANTVQIGIK